MNEERKAMMKECREYYDIFSEDEEKVIIYPHKDIWSMDGVTIEINKKEQLASVLIPLGHRFEYDGNTVNVDGEYGFVSDGMSWVKEGYLVIELFRANSLGMIDVLEDLPVAEDIVKVSGIDYTKMAQLISLNTMFYLLERDFKKNAKSKQKKRFLDFLK